MATTGDGSGTAVDVVIVGAGFAGLYMLHRIRGLGLSAVVVEAGDGVGGTWYWNRYPGARCDVESVIYSYSFSPELEQEWEWSERYATQPELLRYANHVADRFDLRRSIRLRTRVTAARWDGAGRWDLTTDTGDELSARFCVMATGCLSVPKLPEVPGLQRFGGTWYHTGDWPHEGVDFSGQRVAVIGTGSSGIQSIPLIAEQAADVTVFQRTPNYSVPAHNQVLAPERVREVKGRYPQIRAQARDSRGGLLMEPSTESVLAVPPDVRKREFDRRWAEGGLSFAGAFADLLVTEAANQAAADYVHARIREAVRDPEVAERLIPRSYPFGTKRLCVDTGYYAVFNRDNVELVDLRVSPLAEITGTGVRTTAHDHAVDSIVFATGFDAMTGALLRIDVVGRDGLRLAAEWAEGPSTYLGLAMAGFPNLFLVTGPGSPSVLSNMMVSIEQHVDWIAGCIAALAPRRGGTIEATRVAQDAWTAHVNDVAAMTLYPRAASWYTGANVPGKPRVFMPYIGGVADYRRICDGVAANGYEGFDLDVASSPTSENASHIDA